MLVNNNMNLSMSAQSIEADTSYASMGASFDGNQVYVNCSFMNSIGEEQMDVIKSDLLDFLDKMVKSISEIQQ